MPYISTPSIELDAVRGAGGLRLPSWIGHAQAALELRILILRSCTQARVMVKALVHVFHTSTDTDRPSALQHLCCTVNDPNM